jgi:hypothetical protein
MEKFIQRDLLSIAFIANILVFGSSILFLVTLDMSSKGQTLFIIFIVASFFTSLSTMLQLMERRKRFK